jgi:hypothetical protein
MSNFEIPEVHTSNEAEKLTSSSDTPGVVIDETKEILSHDEMQLT